MDHETINESSGEIPIDDLDRVFEILAEKCEFLVRRLRDFVEFPTVSSDPSKKTNILEMATYLVETLKKFGLTASVVPMTFEDVRKDDPPPPLVLAQTELDPAKRTVCFYGHFDVRPLTSQDYWYSDPFVLTSNSDGTVFFGKGSSMGKGPLLCLINAIGAYRQLGIALPVNIKLVMDPMGLSEEEITGKFLRKTNLEFFTNVDFVCMCVGQWFGNVKPSVTHGSRGLCYFSMEIEGSIKDLHSGNYGGLLNEPMSDLVYMMNQLVDKRGTIKITDIYQDVIPVSKEERDYYKTIQFIVRDFKQDLGAQELLANEDKRSLLTNLWRMPSLSIHGIEGAFFGSHSKNTIPCKVTGKFSINLVPNMTPSKVKKNVFDYLNKMWKVRKSANKIKVQMTIGKLAWYTDPTDVNCIAAVNAVKRVYNEEPELVRDSNRVRMANSLRRATNATVVGIPVGKANDVSEANAEKIDLVNYINGCKTFAAYFHEISQISPNARPQEKPGCSCKTTSLAECVCYMKTGWMAEEEESSLEDSVLITCSGTSGFSENENCEEPATSRFYGYSLRVRKKTQALQRLIAEGETVIGSKYSKGVVDAEEQMGEDESAVESVVQRERPFGDAPQQESAVSNQLKPLELNEHTINFSSGKLVRLSKSVTGMEADSSYFSVPKAKKVSTLARIYDGKFGLRQPTNPSLKGLESALDKLKLSPTEIMGPGSNSLLSDKTSPINQKTEEGARVIERGYVGKQPLNMNAMSSNQLEPFGIISSLSALLFKRRAQKNESASVRTLAGSKLLVRPRFSQGSVDNLIHNSSTKVTAVPDSSSELRTTQNNNADEGNGEPSRVHQVFVSIDQPGTSEKPRKGSLSYEKLWLQKLHS